MGDKSLEWVSKAISKGMDQLAVLNVFHPLDN